jgi:DNA-binding NarL/FixJ family response regulator
MKTKSVVIVEDHLLLSQAIAELVNTFEGFSVPYLCSNGKELLKKIKFAKNVPDVVLMDINMPILNGIETTKILSRDYPQVKVIALTVENDSKLILEMLKAGAKSYLLKDAEKEILENALNHTVNYGYYHTPKISNLLVDVLTGEDKSKFPKLKEREIEFLQYACSELTYKEIAKKMFLSPKTVDGYRDVLFQKLNVKNRIGLVLYAIKNKIFNVADG